VSAENQQVVFLFDGGDDVRNLQFYLSPEAEHLLDWFRWLPPAADLMKVSEKIRQVVAGQHALASDLILETPCKKQEPFYLKK
jgi:hypothetical protein